MLAHAVTIVVTTRGEVARMPRLLASVPPSVRLVVMDASTDGAAGQVARLWPHNMLVIRHPGNVAEARQVGADAATTPWVLFTEADVSFSPGYFARLAAALTGRLGAVYGPKRFSDEPAASQEWFIRAQRLAAGLRVPAVSGSNLVVRKSALAAVGGFDRALTCGEAIDLTRRLARHGHRVRFEPGLVVHAAEHLRQHRGEAWKVAHSIAHSALSSTRGSLSERWCRTNCGHWSGASADDLVEARSGVRSS
jgi:GT2 family glycosyltransferase